MNYLGFAGAGVIFCLLALLVKQYRPELASCVSLAGGLALLLAAIIWAEPLISEIRDIASGSGQGENFGIALKAIGVCIIAQTASDICKDAGQQSLAAKIDLGGKLAVLAVSLPLLRGLLETAERIIYG